MAFRTIGCKLNQCETAQMQESLLAVGYQLVAWHEPSDVRVINTCTVTAKSDRTCRHEIRMAKRLDPACLIAVTGCYAQVDPEAVAAIPGVDLVLGNLDKLRLDKHLQMRRATLDSLQSTATTSVSSYSGSQGFDAEFISQFNGYTRAFLKIQTGCDSHCAYCIIPLARGPARSMLKREVLKQVRLLASRDFREVVLTGIDLGSWGHDTGEGTLANLLTLLMENGDVSRYRLSSIEPLGVDSTLLDTLEAMGEQIAHHFHLPLQSGANTVLGRMNRPYSTADYRTVIGELARRFPYAALGTDVIVGFPRETCAEFEETYSFLEHSPLTHFHVFGYSDRPGTAASVMSPKVDPETIHARSLRLRELGKRKKMEFRKRLLGTEQRALVLHKRADDGRLIALTGNYEEVLIGGDNRLINRFVRVRLEHLLSDGRWETTVARLEEAA